MKYSNEQLQWVVDKIESLEWTWEEKYPFIIEGFRDEFNNILNYSWAESLRKLYSKAKRYLAELSTIEQDIQEEGNSFSRLNDMFSDGIPETRLVKWEKYCIFQIKQSEELTGETYLEPVAIKLSIIDNIFHDYVEHGLDMSSQQICDKYGLTGKAWNILKSQMNLNKKSNVVSEPTLDDMSEDDVDDLASSHLSNKNKKKIQRAWDKQVKECVRLVADNRAFLEWVQSYIQDYKPLPVTFKPPKIKNNNSATYFLSDIHIGRWETDDIIRRLAQVQSDIILSPERIIYIENLWDLAESLVPQGWMHSGQHEEMDYRYWFGFDLMMNIVKIMEKFLLEIYKAWKELHFQGITGNHGRITQEKQMDNQRTWELVIYELLKRGLSQTKIDIDYLRTTVSTFTRGNLHYIIGHWDGRPFDNQKPSDIILKHWDTRKFNVIVSWDKHNFQMRDIHDKGLWIKTKALAQRWRYEEQQDYKSLPWYLKVIETQGKAEIILKTL